MKKRKDPHRGTTTSQDGEPTTAIALTLSIDQPDTIREWTKNNATESAESRASFIAPGWLGATQEQLRRAAAYRVLWQAEQELRALTTATGGPLDRELLDLANVISTLHSTCWCFPEFLLEWHAVAKRLGRDRDRRTVASGFPPEAFQGTKLHWTKADREDAFVRDVSAWARELFAATPDDRFLEEAAAALARTIVRHYQDLGSPNVHECRKNLLRHLRRGVTTGDPDRFAAWIARKAGVPQEHLANFRGADRVRQHRAKPT